MANIKTGFRDIDKHIGGMENGELIVIGGRPFGMGKTSLALNIADRCEKTALFYSLDGLSTFQINRIRHMEKQIWLSEYLPYTTDAERKAAPLVSICEVRELLLNAKKYCDFIIVDYIQLISSEATKELKALAREINKPILALSQIKRNVDNRKDKRPKIEDIGVDKKQINYIDKALLIYRENYYTAETNPEIAEIITYKNPQAKPEKIYLRYEFQRYGIELFDL